MKPIAVFILTNGEIAFYELEGKTHLENLRNVLEYDKLMFFSRERIKKILTDNYNPFEHWTTDTLE